MYGKIFESMYTGTLYGQWEAIITFQQMIVLADEDGIVDYTPPALAAKTSIPLEHIEKGIEILEAPDKYSRSPGHDGRRIVRVDESRPWGWQIVNYAHYRNLANREDKKRKDRERIAEKRKKNNDVARCRKVSQGVANVAHTDTDTEKKINKRKTTPGDDWWPGQSTLHWFSGQHFDFTLDDMVETYIDGCNARGYKYVDHDSAFRNWCKRRKKDQPDLPAYARNRL